MPHEGALRILVSPGIDVGNDTKVLASVIGPYGTVYRDIIGISRHYRTDQLVIRFREAASKGLNVSWLAWNGDRPGGGASNPELRVVSRESSRTVDVPPTGTGEPVAISSGCLEDEVAISGGITVATAGMKNLDYFSSGPFFDGHRSGWSVQWINRGTETAHSRPPWPPHACPDL